MSSLFNMWLEGDFDSTSANTIEVDSSNLFSAKKPNDPYPKKTARDIIFEFSNQTDLATIFENSEILTNGAEDSTENFINDARSKLLDETYTNRFIKLLREEEFEFGYISRSEQLLHEQLKINALATRNWLNKIFINNFQDEAVLIGILRIIGRFEPNVIFPQGQTIALAALVHSSDEIKELGVRAFEKWVSNESLNILRGISIETIWLKEYIDSVIRDFEEFL